MLPPAAMSATSILTDVQLAGVAKLYQTSSPSFGIEMPWGEKQLNNNSFKKDNNYIKNEITKKFLKGFINNDNFFDGLIIVGSPNPHGIFKTSARDGQCRSRIGVER